MIALPIARLAGFEIRIHLSWALVLAFTAAAVATRLEGVDPRLDDLGRWAAGAAVAGLFLVSAVAHELAHALVARRAGAPGGPVVVYFFGSPTWPVVTTGRPRDEVVVALAGPLTSLGIGAVALIAGLVADLVVGSAAPAMVDVLVVVGLLDIVLGAANLLPAYPLDGGQAVRGLAWWRTGDPDRALSVAAATGRGLGILLAVLGAGVVIRLDVSDGVMLALCGWFLLSSARAAERLGEVERRMAGICVGDVMDRDIARIPAGLTLDTFAEQALVSGGAVAVADGDEVVGVLGLRQVRRVRRDRWRSTRARDVMAATADLPTLVPATGVRAALEAMRRTQLDGLPVVDGVTVVGIVTRRAIGDAVRARAHDPGSVA